MNVYDFDRTIYKKDCTVDFWKYCFRKYPRVRVCLLGQLLNLARFLSGRLDTTSFKEKFFVFLRKIPDPDQAIEEFWNKNLSKIKDFYIDTKKDNDLIISASPEFLVCEACKRLGVNAIGSRVDIHTGLYSGFNCGGAEKTKRYREIFGDTPIDEFYSDSRKDAPLARMAEKAFLVRGNRILEYPY
jgi:phosphoserine phosphatase